MKPRAYSYIRISTDIQRKGDGLNRQLQLSAEYASKIGLELDTAFRLRDEGVSAFRGDNATSGKLREFLDAVSDGRVPKGSFLLIESLDRLSRQTVVQSLFLFLDLIRAGINIVTLADERVYGADVDEMQLIMSIFVMSRAHEESEIKSMRLAKAWEAKRADAKSKKLTGKCPMWLQLSSDKGSFLLIDDRVATIRKIFTWSAEGAGAFTIARRLNRLGEASFKGLSSWGTSSVSKILGNRAVLGEMQPHMMVDGRRKPIGDPITGYFPQIVDEELFERAQGARISRRVSSAGRRGVGQQNLFTHVAKCARCGSPMHLLDKGPKPKGSVILRCSSAIKGTGCRAKSWNYQHFERAFLSYVREVGLRELIGGEGSLESLAKAEAIRQSEARLAELRHKRDRTFDLASAEELSEEFYRQKADALFRQIREEEARLDQFRAHFASLQSVARVENIDELISAVQPASLENEEVRIRASAAIKAIVRSLKLEAEEPSSPLLLPLLNTIVGPVEMRVVDRQNRSRASFRVSLLGGVERRVVVNKSDGTMSVSEWSDEICQAKLAKVSER